MYSAAYGGETLDETADNRLLAKAAGPGTGGEAADAAGGTSNRSLVDWTYERAAVAAFEKDADATQGGSDGCFGSWEH